MLCILSQHEKELPRAVGNKLGLILVAECKVAHGESSVVPGGGCWGACDLALGGRFQGRARKVGFALGWVWTGSRGDPAAAFLRKSSLCRAERVRIQLHWRGSTKLSVWAEECWAKLQTLTHPHFTEGSGQPCLTAVLTG